MKRFGTQYGGFYYPENLDGLDQSSIIYCIGAGEDISHDIEIANKLNSNVFIIDPTPRAKIHCDYVKNVLDGKDKVIYDNKFGGSNPYIYWKIILENKIDTNKIIYKNYGIGIEDGLQKFYLPSNEEYVSCSLVEGMKGNKYINVHVKKLKSIMNDLGHNKIDLLKMDIEGSECDVIENMLEEQIYPKYLAVEFDNIIKKKYTQNLLEKNNYKLLYQDNNNYVYKYNINVCIIHIGYKKYLEENIKITSKTNKIYLIGDNSVKCLEKYENVIYVDIEEFMKSEKINYYKSKYVNYANYDFNWIWIAGPGRIFTIQLFLEKYKFNHIFNIDSDCILLKDINNYPFKQDIAYCINQNYENKYRMSNSIHSALLDKNFCIKFEKLYNDLYINKSKFKLIEDKINYHKNNNISGGICEMTLCYLLQNENYISVDNLLEIKNHNNTKLTFMNTLYSNESSENKDQYLKENNIIKIYDINGEKKIYDKINQEYIELWNIHYQGDCKKLLEYNETLEYNEKSEYNEKLDLLIVSTFKHNYEYLKAYHNFYKKIWKCKKFLFYMGIYTNIKEHIKEINQILDIKLIKYSYINYENNYMKKLELYNYENIYIIFYETQKHYDSHEVWISLKEIIKQITKSLNNLNLEYNIMTDCDDFCYVKNPYLEITKNEIEFHNLEFIPQENFSLKNNFDFISNHYYFRIKGLNKPLNKKNSHNYCHRIFVNDYCPHIGECKYCSVFDNKYQNGDKISYKNMDNICFSFGCLSKDYFINNMFWDQSSSDCKMINNIDKKELEENFNKYYKLSDDDKKNNVILTINDLKEFFI